MVKQDVSSFEIIKALRLFDSSAVCLFPKAGNAADSYAAHKVWWGQILRPNIQALTGRKYLSENEFVVFWEKEFRPFICAMRDTARLTNQEDEVVKALSKLERALLAEPIKGVESGLVEFYFNKSPNE